MTSAILHLIYGSLVIGAAAAMMYFNVMILNNFEEHEDVSMTMFFLDDRAPEAFHVLAATMLVFSAGMINAAFDIVEQSTLFDLFAGVSTLVLFGGITYFLQQIAAVTEEAG